VDMREINMFSKTIKLSQQPQFKQIYVRSHKWKGKVFRMMSRSFKLIFCYYIISLNISFLWGKSVYVYIKCISKLFDALFFFRDINYYIWKRRIHVIQVLHYNALEVWNNTITPTIQTLVLIFSCWEKL